MVIKCEKKTIEERLGQRKLNIRGNKEIRAVQSWKEGPGWQRGQQAFFPIPSLLFYQHLSATADRRPRGRDRGDKVEN